MRRLLNKKVLIIVGVVVIIVAAVVFIKKRNGSVSVTQITPEPTKVVKSVSASGAVVSSDEANMSFPVGGSLVYIGVAEGEEVKKGTLLAQLYNPDLAQTAQAKKDARDVAIRDRDLYIENYSTNFNAVGGEDEYNIGVSRQNELVQVAESTYQASLGTLGKSYLYAPFDGTAVDVNGKIGESVAATATVVKVANLGDLIFEVGVDQEDFGFLKTGQTVLIVLDAYEDTVFKGEVGELPLFADETTEEFTIEIKIEQDAKNPVLLGMTGDAEVIIEESGSEIPSLTFDQVYSDDEGDYVWIDEGGHAKKMYIEIGLEGDIYTEVKTDLTGVVVIIPEGDDELEEGAKIKIAE